MFLKKIQRKENGFSLIELMVVLVIIVVLTILVLTGYSESGSRLELEKTVEEFIQSINNTKSRAFGSSADYENEEVVKFDKGIFLETGSKSYILFSDKNETGEYESGEEEEIFEIDERIIISEISVENEGSNSSRSASSLSIIFSVAEKQVFFSEPENTSTITFSLEKDGEIKKKVKIDSFGVSKIIYE